MVRVLGVITFIGFVCLWFKTDGTDDRINDNVLAGRSVRELPGGLSKGIAHNIELPPNGNDNDLLAAPNNNLNFGSREKIVKHVESKVNNFNLSPQFHNKAVKISSYDGLEKKVIGGNVASSQERARALAMFAADDEKIVPGLGAMGKAVQLSGAEASHAEEVIKVEAFNKVLSDKISVNRTVPDSRDPM